MLMRMIQGNRSLYWSGEREGDIARPEMGSEGSHYRQWDAMRSFFALLYRRRESAFNGRLSCYRDGKLGCVRSGERTWIEHSRKPSVCALEFRHQIDSGLIGSAPGTPAQPRKSKAAQWRDRSEAATLSE